MVTFLVAEHGLWGAQASGVSCSSLQRAGSVMVAHGLSCSLAHGVFPDQGPKLCLLDMDSYPLCHQGSSDSRFLLGRGRVPWVKQKGPQAGMCAAMPCTSGCLERRDCRTPGPQGSGSSHQSEMLWPQGGEGGVGRRPGEPMVSTREHSAVWVYLVTALAWCGM